MDYDIWGSWSAAGVGPNAPLADSCSPYRDGSAVSAINAWTAAQFPTNKILLGVPSYGHSFFVLRSDAIVNGQLASYPPFNCSLQPHGDSWDAPTGVDACGTGNPTQPGGIFNFWGLVENKWLTALGDPAAGNYYRFDSCSQTVCLFCDFGWKTSADI
jgi:chitinase